MDTSLAKFVIENLLNRITKDEEGMMRLDGTVTPHEYKALEIAVQKLDRDAAEPKPEVNDEFKQTQCAIKPIPEFKDEGKDDSTGNGLAPELDIPEVPVELDLSVLSLPESPNNVRLCLDFGTAMSKATLVVDDLDFETEDIHVLKLGVPGDQQEISELMLMSSVYISNDGNLWFGQKAVALSMDEGADGSRQRLDNIKRWLSEGVMDTKVDAIFNPTGMSITYGDMVLAYLMFMTWTINDRLENELDYPRNLKRRFAMPCLPSVEAREVESCLKKLIGEAQILADTFYTTLKQGVPIECFIKAVHEIRQEKRDYSFVTENLTEPLGVAGTLFSWTKRVDMLMMVVDIGAGTSDFSLFRVLFDPEKDQNTTIEIPDTAKGLTEAGNHLDNCLKQMILDKANITSEDPMSINIYGQLELSIRDYKESLFNDGFVFVNLINGKEVDVELDDFLRMDAVKGFGDDLREKMVSILESIDLSWLNWVKADPTRNLVVVLTGGGASLPMVQDLVTNSVDVNGLNIPVAKAASFPPWLQEIDENLDEEYPRIAVSLGGARRLLMQKGEGSTITAGDVVNAPTLADPRLQW